MSRSAPSARRIAPIDLGVIARCYTLNYIQLSRLVPASPEMPSPRFMLAATTECTQEIIFDWLEQSPYTQTVMVRLPKILNASNFNYPIALRVRLYHDVKVAEVLDWNRQRPVEGRFDYPNTKMFMPDEKFQVNQFLRECLEKVYRLGCSAIDSSSTLGTEKPLIR